jgi:nucleoside-diphosphate-sugar epimerase
MTITSLVTGGAGFIGSHIVQALLERGDHVRVLDNFSTGSRANLETALQRYTTHLTVIEGDLRDATLVAQTVRGVDYIFHHAAYVSAPQSVSEPGTCFAINTHGTTLLFEAARQAKVRQVVIASSAAVYGNSQALPLIESTPLAPISPYAASKLSTEIYAGLYTRIYDLPIVALRYFNVYGPRQSPKSMYAAAIPIFIQRLLTGIAPTIYGDGGQTRDFINVADVARANLLAAETPAAGGQVYNICSGEAISLLDLLATLAQIIPQAPAPQFAAPRPGDIYRSLGDPTYAATSLGFKPQIDLYTGLAEVVNWMRGQSAKS